MAPNLGLNEVKELKPTGTPTYSEGEWGVYKKPEPIVPRIKRREIDRKLKKLSRNGSKKG